MIPAVTALSIQNEKRVAPWTMGGDARPEHTTQRPPLRRSIVGRSSYAVTHALDHDDDYDDYADYADYDDYDDNSFATRSRSSFRSNGLCMRGFLIVARNSRPLSVKAPPVMNRMRS